MFSVFFKCYYRPLTDVPVAFRFGYTDVPFKVIAKIQGLRVNTLFLPVSAVIDYSGMYQGVVVPGSEECRFQAQNSDYSFKMYLFSNNLSREHAKQKEIYLSRTYRISDLLLR